ncbi:MAG: trypsin-like serine protease [Planctomycetia bacterium]
MLHQVWANWVGRSEEAAGRPRRAERPTFGGERRFDVLEDRSVPVVGATAAVWDAGAPAAETARAVPRIINGQPTADFPAVGIVGSDASGFCTGTLISNRHVLTAAHCIADELPNRLRFTVGGRTVGVARTFIFPTFITDRLGEDKANDLAIMELATPVNDIAPMPILRTAPSVGQVLTLVGFGATGTPNGGADGSFGNKQVGRTPIDQVTRKLIRWNFNSPSESNTAPGDSGGPAFVDVGGRMFIAGITSGGTIEDASLGDKSYDTRIDVFASWIDRILAGGGQGRDDFGDDFSKATRVAARSNNRLSVTGAINFFNDRDVMRFRATKTGRVTLTVTARDSENLDSMVKVFNSGRRSIAANDDFDGTNSRVSFSVRAGQTYFVRVSNFDNTIGEYRVRMTPGRSMNRVGATLAPNAPKEPTKTPAPPADATTGKPTTTDDCGCTSTRAPSATSPAYTDASTETRRRHAVRDSVLTALADDDLLLDVA